MRTRKIGSWVVVLLMALFVLVPLIILFLNSFKTKTEVIYNPFGVPSEGFHLTNYPEAWEKGNYSHTLVNSSIITVITIIGVLIVSGMSAYSISRLKVKRGGLLISFLILISSIPIQMYVVPLFVLWSSLDLTNNLLGLAIIYIALQSPFATLLLRSYMIAIPETFDESARIDGASEFTILRKILLPILWPSFLTVGLVSGLYAWNEFLLAVTFINKPDLKPVSTSLYAFTSRFSQDWALTSAASIIMLLPVLILFLLLQKQFIAGLTQGGLKE